MPDDLRWSWCNNRNKVHSKYQSVQVNPVRLCDPMDCSTPGFPVHHQLQEFAQTHVHRVSDAIHPSISSSIIPFSSCPQSFPSSVSFPMGQFFPSGSQSTGVSASASVLPMNTQDWYPLGWTGWIALAVQVTLKSLLQHHSSKASISSTLSFLYSLSHPYMTIGKTIALTRWTFVGKANMNYNQQNSSLKE